MILTVICNAYWTYCVWSHTLQSIELCSYVCKKSCLILLYVGPIFKNQDVYLASYDCYEQKSPIIEYGDKVTMSVDVSVDNLTLIWTVTTNDQTKVIDKHNQDYVLEDKNKEICIILCSLLLLTTVINLGHSTVLNVSWCT